MTTNTLIKELCKQIDPCPVCSGSGQLLDNPLVQMLCVRCDGVGKILNVDPLTIPYLLENAAELYD